MESAMKRLSVILILSISLSIVGCAGMSDTQQRTLSGGAIGAGAGAAVGAAAGSAGGFLFGKHEDQKQEAYKEGYEAGQKSKP
jgi:drug/metabolite transporter (DMT)-like permease